MSFSELSSLNVDAWFLWAIYWFISAFFANKTKSAEGRLARYSHLLPMYVAMFLIFHGRHPPYFGRLYESTGVEAIGDLLTFGGLLFCVWARVHLGRYWSGIITIKEGHRLIRSGPYQFVRHPIYTGMITAVLGSAVMMSTVDGFLGLLLFWVTCAIKAKREEARLTPEFGEEYPRFRQEVPFLIPYRLGGIRKNLLNRDRADHSIHSDAFAAAALRSEQFRLAGILVVLAFLAAVGITRSFFAPEHKDAQRVAVFLAVLFVAAAFEGITLLIIHHAQRTGRRLRGWFWALGTFVECSFPTFILLGLTVDESYAGPYRALVTSPALIYFLFIILATMRLSPWLCLLYGCISSLQYLALYAFTLHVAPHNPNREILNPSTYVLFPAYLFFAGLLAAGVTRRIRRHVVAALNEVETRRKLDRVEFDLTTARSIQMGLLPKNSPHLPGYDIAGWSRPADQTGGDYYDWIALPDGKVLFIIADVAGHGIGPALLTVACRAYFRAVATESSPLEQVMKQVDALLTPDTPDGRFITAAIALLDPSDATLTLYSAAHAPLYLYSAATHTLQELDADQPPLGLGQCNNPLSPARRLTLSPGDALIFVTDGFFEWPNPGGEMMGTERLGQTILNSQNLSAEKQIQRLHQDVLAFAQGTPQSDDLTAIIIKRAP